MASPTCAKRPGEALADKGLRERAEVDVVSVVTHVRAATAGSDNIDNCHPFEMDGLLVAHNGGFSDLKAVEAQLGDYRDLVHGDTDSERYAALIAKETSVHDGDVGAGIVAAADWLRTHVPLYSLNTVVISRTGCGRCATRTSGRCTSPGGWCIRARVRRTTVGRAVRRWPGIRWWAHQKRRLWWWPASASTIRRTG